MKRVLTLIGISLCLAILDNAFMPYLAIKGYYPSLLYVFLICYSINNGMWEGLWIGILAGLLQDIFFVNVFGINSILNMFMGIISGYIGCNIFKEKIFIPAFSTLLLSIVKGVMLFVILYIIKVHINLENVFFISLYNMAAAIIMYKPVYNLCQKKYMQKRWKF